MNLSLCIRPLTGRLHLQSNNQSIEIVTLLMSVQRKTEHGTSLQLGSSKHTTFFFQTCVAMCRSTLQLDAHNYYTNLTLEHITQAPHVFHIFSKPTL